MGGGNAQKSKTARERNLEKNKASKGSQLDTNKKAMSIQCKVCMQTFMCTTTEVKCREHAEAKHPKHDITACFPHQLVNLQVEPLDTEIKVMDMVTMEVVMGMVIVLEEPRVAMPQLVVEKCKGVMVADMLIPTVREAMGLRQVDLMLHRWAMPVDMVGAKIDKHSSCSVL